MCSGESPAIAQSRRSHDRSRPRAGGARDRSRSQRPATLALTLLALGIATAATHAASTSPTGSWAWGESLNTSGIPLTSAQLSYLQTQQEIAGGAVPTQDLSQKQVDKFKEILRRPLANLLVTRSGSAARVQAASTGSSTNLNGTLPSTPAVNYLQWQRSLNSAQFDKNHPTLGAALAQSSANQSLPNTSHDTTPAASTLAPTLGTPSPTASSPQYATPITYAHYVGTPPSADNSTPPSADNSTPPCANNSAPVAVPEPSSWALILIGAGFLARAAFRSRTAHRAE